jgi:hypothetical protein
VGNPDGAGLCARAVRWLVFAHKAVAEMILRSPVGRRIYASGSAQDSNGPTLPVAFAGDVRGLLAEAGAIVVQRPNEAEFRLHLERDVPLLRFQDAAGYTETAVRTGLDAVSILRPLGWFIQKSDARRRGSPGATLDWNNPRFRRAVFAAALVVQITLGWSRRIFIFQRAKPLTLPEYVIIMGPLVLTNILLYRAHMACRRLVPQIRGKKIFVCGRGKNLDGREMTPDSYGAALATQGAEIVVESDEADVKITLGEITTEVVYGACRWGVVTDENHIASALRRMLRAGTAKAAAA